MFASDHRLTTNGRKGYNGAVNSPVPMKPVADNKRQDTRHRHRHSIYAAEATGLLLMAVLLLVLTIIRYWRDIPLGPRLRWQFLNFPEFPDLKEPQPPVPLGLRSPPARE